METHPGHVVAVQVEELSFAGSRLGAAVRLAIGDAALQERIATASPIYALLNSVPDIVQHAQLVEPLCDPSEVRVRSFEGRTPDTWSLIISAQDRPGLLARFTGVLLEAGIGVERAVLACWEDGAALQALDVVSPRPPDVRSLSAAFASSLLRGISAPPVDSALVVFDHSDDTVFTSCEVTAPDQPGLLHAIAVAIANAGANIHTASVRTFDGLASDLFDLSDADNDKLAPAVARAIEENLRRGT